MIRFNGFGGGRRGKHRSCVVSVLPAAIAWATAALGQVQVGPGDSLQIEVDHQPKENVSQSDKTVRAGCFLSSPAMPDTLGPKNRFLSFSAGDPGRLQAIRITFSDLPPPYDVWNGQALWVAEPQTVPDMGCLLCPIPLPAPTLNAATLQCTPLFIEWGQVTGDCFDDVCRSSLNLADGCLADSDCVPAVVHVFHEGIVPGALYELQVIDSSCDINDENSYSTPLEITTARWGDVVSNCATRPCGPPNASIDIIDALVILEKFISDPAAPIKTRTDLEPACLDLVINISDVLSVLTGFQGLSYPFAPSAEDPCDSTCPNPLP